MGLSYDIFSGKHGSGDVRWVEAAQGLGNAYTRMKELAAENRGFGLRAGG
jgi:hypothetical protein